MRKLVAGLALLLGAACAVQPGGAASASTAGPMGDGGASITFLGTAGGPPPHRGESQPASLLQVDGKSYLIDAGENAGQQLLRAGAPSERLDAVFITHLHWDHVLGLDYLMAVGWMRGRRAPLPIYGPPGLGAFASLQLAAVGFGETIFRSQADWRPSLAGLYPAHDVPDCDPTEVFRDEAVAVTATCNSHFAAVRAPDHDYGEDRSLSYRFDTRYGSVTFTGDTGPSEALERLARGSDVLVSEIVDLPSMERALELANPGGDHSTLMTHMRHQHLTPEDVGKLATRAGVRRLILTHFVYGPGFKPEEFKEQVAAFFDGEIIVAKDLDRFAFSGEAP